MAEKFDNLEEHLEKFIENIRQLGIIVSDFQPSSQAGLNQKLWVMFYRDRHSGTNLKIGIMFTCSVGLSSQEFHDLWTARHREVPSTASWDQRTAGGLWVSPVAVVLLCLSGCISHITVFSLHICRSLSLLYCCEYTYWLCIANTSLCVKATPNPIRKSDDFIVSFLVSKSDNVKYLYITFKGVVDGHFKIRHVQLKELVHTFSCHSSQCTVFFLYC